MTLKIDLPIDSEAALRARAAACGMDIESFVRIAIQEKLAEPVFADATNGTSRFRRALQSIIELHPVSSRLADDSRNSIYDDGDV